jgi:DNA-binding MarR family transcriptional regulator
MAVHQDHIDWIVEAWRREMPEVDTSPMAVVGRLLRAARHLELAIERRLADFGLNMTEFNVLAALRRTGSPFRMAPVDLSRSLLLSSGGLTKRIDRLEAHGLVERSPDPKDRRSVLVGLTEAGRELIEPAVAEHLTNEAGLIAALSSEQRETLNSVLRSLLVSLDDGRPQRRRARLSRPAPYRS